VIIIITIIIILYPRVTVGCKDPEG